TDVLPGENQSESVGETDSARQTLRAAGAGNESELNLGKTENRLWMIGGNAISARECRLESAAEAGAVDCGNYRNTQPLDGVEQHLSIPAQPLGVSRCLELKKLVDVRAGNPHIRLAADEYGRMHRHVALKPGDERHEFVFHGAT